MGFVLVWKKATDTSVGSDGFLSAKLADIHWCAECVVFQACDLR